MLSRLPVISLLYSTALIFILSASNALAFTVPETPPSAWNEGSFGVQTSTEYFTSKANYDVSRGAFEDLPAGNSWTSFENRAKLRFGFTRNFAIFAGLGYGSSTAKTSLIENTNSSITEVFAGANFLLARRWWRVVPEIEVSYPGQQTQYLQTNPLTSDGAPYARAGVFLFKPYKYLRFESYLGAHFPGEGLAKRFQYSLAAELALLGSFTLGGGVQGYETIISDDTSFAERRATQATANATSERFWAYNPALIEAKGWVGFRFDKAFNVRLGYAKTINGVRNAEGQSFLINLNFSSAGSRKKRSNGVQVEQVPVSRDSRDFKTEPEANDPEYFDQRDSLDNTERLLENR